MASQVSGIRVCAFPLTGFQCPGAPSLRLARPSPQTVGPVSPRRPGTTPRPSRRPVESEDSAIAVLAGPGSGKTRVLSYRARRLLILDPSSKALLLTFTNKAAAEMKARALQVATVTSDRVWASTFHTFGMRVLHAHGDLVGVGREFETLDDEEREALSQEAALAAGVSDRYRRWSYLRLRRREAHEAEVVRFGQAYEAAKRDRGVLDFDDLIVYTADLFEQHEEVATAYATKYPHLLVDEFQDTNAAQFAIVRALARGTRTVSVFADDDQAIYRFAGAEAENVRRFMIELGATEFPLTVNYRCRQAVVDCANRLIAADPQASGRQMRSFHGAVTCACSCSIRSKRRRRALLTRSRASSTAATYARPT